MVQSETFVSRRKKRAERRAPRKLFTARGLVGDETQDTDSLALSRHSKENDSTLLDEPKANMSMPQVGGLLNQEKMRRDHEIIARCDEKWDQSSHPPSYDSEFEESSRSSSLGNSLDDVMQMGCMDNLFFTSVMNKSRPSIFPLQNDKKSVEAFMTLPLPKLNFMKQDDGQSGQFRSTQTNFPGRLDCHLPYQHIADQVAEAQLLTTIKGQYFGFDRRSNRTPHKVSFPLADHEKRTRHEEWNSNSAPINRRAIDFPILSLESPPSHIFIGEQPCLSEDLIPVDDVPPPGVQCNLTKYHPKPLTLRQNYAFGKPMLSVDSDESDPASEVSGKRSRPERNEWTGQSPLDEANMGTPHFDERSYPSFDETEPFSVSRGTNETKSESIIRCLNVEVEDRSDFATSYDEKNTAFTRSSVTGGSHAGSAATDQAITSELPKRTSISFQAIESRGEAECEKQAPTQHATVNPLLSGKKSGSMASSMDDDNVSSTFIQDENNSPPHMSLDAKVTSYGMAKSHDQSSLAHCQKSFTMGSHARGLQSPPYQVPSITESRRKPLDLMVAANLPYSPSAYVDEEFFSPKANSPKNRNTAMTTDARRFRFEDSFDESEFFDTMA